MFISYKYHSYMQVINAFIHSSFHQESIREALLVQNAAVDFINGNTLTPYCLFGTLLIPYKS